MSNLDSDGDGNGDDGSDGFPDCIDCLPEDDRIGYDCPDCSQPFEDLAEKCKAENNIYEFDYVTCGGSCNDVNNGPPCPELCE